MPSFDDPSHRASLSPAAYEAERSRAASASILETANGHAIRAVQSRFGRLFAVGSTRRAFSCRGEARAFALFGETAETSLAALSAIYGAYLKAEGLPEADALELLHEDLSDDQRAWVSAFLIKWEAVEEAARNLSNEA